MNLLEYHESERDILLKERSIVRMLKYPCQKDSIRYLRGLVRLM